MEWNLTGNVDALRHVTPMIQAEGRSVKHIIDQVIDRRRLYGYVIEPQDDNKIDLRIFTYNINDVETPAPNSFTITANQDVRFVPTNDSNTIRDVVVTQSSLHQYQKVIARGERATTTFTLGVNSPYNNLETDWSDDEETAYELGASGLGPEYDDATLREKQDKNKEVRLREELRPVFRHFRVPSDWDFKTGTVDEEIFSSPQWVAGTRFLSYLPLLTETTYESFFGAPFELTDNSDDGTEREFRRPFGLILTTPADSTTHYQYLDRMAGGENTVHPETEGRNWSASLRMQDNGMGIVVDVHGVPQHVIAKNHFNAVSDDADLSDYPADLDYDNMLVTVAMEQDNYAQGEWPEDPQGEFVPLEKTLLIKVPGARLDFLAINTVMGTDIDGSLVYSSEDFQAEYRDDTPRLKDIARISYEWYSEDRSSIRYTDRRGGTSLFIGDMLTGIDPPLSTVVVSISFDLNAGTNTVQTQTAQLNAALL
jgi:hypothetical protein